MLLFSPVQISDLPAALDVTLSLINELSGTDSRPESGTKSLFSIPTGGHYGMINEMYVKPKNRIQNIGKKLIEKTLKISGKKNWRRIDINALLEERRTRTIQFYEKEDYRYPGEKLQLTKN
jgi:GNAT superfamily N-acetyltransferase